MEIKYRIDLNKLLPENPVTAELGVAEGNFSRDICENWKPSKHYCVDNWGTISGVTGDGNFPQEWHNENYKSAMAKLQPFLKIVEVLRGYSWNMAQWVQNESLDLVYLDANHSEEGVMKDLEAWFPKVKPGGIVAGHDFENQDYGVKQAAYRFCLKEGIDLHRIPEDKWEDAGFWFRKPLKKK